MNRIIILLLFATLLSAVFTKNAEDNKKKLEESKKMVKNLENNDKETKTANELNKAGVINAKPETIDLLKKKKTDLTQGFDKFDVRDGANIANAVATGVTKGLPDLVKGIKTKNWYYITVGALNLLTALTVVIGGPYGAMVGSVLSIITVVLQIFGAPTTESQEDMFTRILTDMQVDELKTEVAGVKMYFETLQVVVTKFRQRLVKIDKEEATALFTLSFSHVAIFGKLQEKIEKFCFVGPFVDADKTKKDLDVKRCLGLVKGYLKLSILKQLLLAEMAGLCQEATGCYYDYKKLSGLTDNFFELIKEAQVLDEKVLGFLADPMGSVSARYTIYKLYSVPEDNMEIIEYLRRMDINADADTEAKKMDKMFNQDGVVICSKQYFQGLCQLVDKKEGTQTLSNWKDTMSMFIPPGLAVKGTVDKTAIGPFQGLAVYSSAKELLQLNTLEVYESEIDLATTVRICTGNAWCDMIEAKETQQGLDKESFHGIKMTKLESISIPSGMQVTLINEGKSKVAGPFYGEITLKDISAHKWKQIIATISPDQNAADMVTVCEQEEFQGYCQQLGDKFLSETPVKFAELKDDKGVKKLTVEKVMSMKVPAGMEVKLFSSISKISVMSGPYKGPLEIAKLGDGSIDSASMKNILVEDTSKNDAKEAKNPATQSSGKPAAQPAAKPATQPAAKPATKPAVKPAAKAPAKTSAKPFKRHKIKRTHKMA